MEINYPRLLPLALKALYPDPVRRNDVLTQLQTYGAHSFHREPDRVRLGILYLASRTPDRLDAYIDLACTDYRDLLSAAEYPHSSRHWGLRERDPAKYAKLRAREDREYLAWVEQIEHP